MSLEAGCSRTSEPGPVTQTGGHGVGWEAGGKN